MKKLIMIAVTLLTMNAGASTLQILNPGRVYDVSPHTTNWKAGYTAVFVGSRLPLFDRETYLERLTIHVNQVRREFGKSGLLGYVVYSNGDGEIAYINWVSEKAMNDTFASPIGKMIMGDAGSFMHTEKFEAVSTNDLFKLLPPR